MPDHLYSWLDARFSDTSADADWSGLVIDEAEQLNTIGRLSRCAKLLERVWPSNEAGQSAPSDDSFLGIQGDQFGRFRIRNLLGRGGMGCVFRAYDPVIGRDVALKIPHPGLLLDDLARRRFAREAQAAGILRHPSIVPVLESGDIGAVCYLAFEYCDGPSLSSWLEKNRQQLTVAHAVSLCVNLAEAVQHAHDRGVVHRDLKPSNILLEFGSKAVAAQKPTSTDLVSVVPTPRITDFGLARLTSVDSTLTRTGVTVGTAEYMGPEQSMASTEVVDPASDQFSLGIILYQLLTGVSPFRRENLAQTIAAVQTEDPLPPSRLNRQVTRDLDAVCLKALHKQPQQRYATTGHLADDLLRFLEGRPTEARPLRSWDRAARWIARNKAVALTTAVCFACLTLVSVVGWVSANRVRQALDRTQDLLYAADIRLSGQALESGNGRHALQLLARHLPTRETDRVSFTWRYLWSLIHKEEAIFELPDNATPYLTRFSPDGDRVVASDGDGRVYVWDAHSHEKIQQVEWASESIQNFEFMKNSNQLVVLFESGAAVVGEIGSNQSEAWLFDKNGIICSQYDREANEVVSADPEGWIKIRKLGANEKPRIVGQHVDLNELAISVDGNWIITVGQASSIKLWKRGTGELVHDRFEHSIFDEYGGRKLRLDTVAISPLSDRFAVGSNTGHIFVWDLKDFQELAHFSDHTSNIYDLDFSPDNLLLASASKDSTVRLWDLQDRVQETVIQGHGRPVYGVRYSPDGRQLATCGKEGAVRLWDRPADPYTELRESSIRPLSGSLAPSSKSFVVSNGGGQPFLQHFGNQTTQSLPFRCDTELPIFSFSMDERFVAVASKRVFSNVSNAGLLDQPDEPVRLADLDGDGDDDAISAFGNWRHAVWRENVGSARLEPPRLLKQEPDIRRISRQQMVQWKANSTVADILCLPSEGTIRISPAANKLQESRGDGFATLHGFESVTSAWPVDLNRDGRQDLVVTDYGLGEVQWIVNDESLSFRVRHTIASGIRAYGVVAGDVNHDELEDIIVVADDSSLQMMEQRRDGSFTVPRLLGNGVPTPAILDLRDWNGDGQLDILCASRQSIVVFENSSGHFQGPKPIQEFADWVRAPASNVIIWDRKERRLVSHFSALATSHWSVAMSPDSSRIVTADPDRNIIHVWRTTDGRLLQTLTPIQETGGIRKVTFSLDGQKLLFAAGDNAYIWDLTQNRPVHTLRGHDNTIVDIAHSSDGRLVATASHDYSVRVWDANSGKQIYALLGHKQTPQVCTFSPNGDTLVTGGDRGELVLWDLITGQQLLTLSQLQCKRMFEVGFTDDNCLVALSDSYENNEYRGVQIGMWRAADVFDKRSP